MPAVFLHRIISTRKHGNLVGILLPQKPGKQSGKEGISIDQEYMFQLASLNVPGVTDGGRGGEKGLVNHITNGLLH